MAETVKKSRIVSETDQNLEESLLEEFNLRLKKCMSRENVGEDADAHIYENMEVIKTNGVHDTKNDLYDVPKVNGLKTDVETVLQPTTCLIELSSSTNECLPEDQADLKTVKDRMLLSTDDVSCLLFTQTVTSPMLTPSEENIDFLKGFQRSEPNQNGEHVYENVEILNTQDIKETTTKFIENETHMHIQSSNTEETQHQDDAKNEEANVQEETNEGEVETLNTLDQSSTLEHLHDTTNVCADTNICVSTVSQSHFVQTTTEMHSSDDKSLKKKKTKKAKSHHEKENISVNETNTNEQDEESLFNVNVKNLCRSFGDLTKIDAEQRNKKNNERSKSSFSKFDALQKKNAINNHTNEHEMGDACKGCAKAVFQMERIVAERCVWHRNCFRCHECSKQLLVDNFESHEGNVYCKPHFKALFAPKIIEDEYPTSDKPDLGLEELHSLNVKERFQVFENAQNPHDSSQYEKNPIKMERSPSILSKLARFQAKGMDIGVTNDSLNGVVLSESEDDEQEDDVPNGEDADLVRAKRVQKEKPFHFVQMSDVKSKWEQGSSQIRDDRREERKQEIQNIRSRLFLGKQGKMKEAYQQAIAESESQTNLKREVPVEPTEAARTIKDKFEKGEVVNNDLRNKETEDMSVFESAISKNSRSIFQELDANSGKVPKITSPTPPKTGTSVRNAREAYIARQATQETVKESDQVDEITVRTADIQDRFKFFETYKEPLHTRKEFRMTPPREGQTKTQTPERELLSHDIVRSDETIEDSVVAKTEHTTTKMLSKFRQMEENLTRQQDPCGLKPLKRFTPPREPARKESSSEQEDSGSEDIEDNEDELDNGRIPEQDLLEAQKAARAQKLRAKFERWEENEIKREGSINVMEEMGEDQSQIQTARSLRAKFESLHETTTTSSQKQTQRVKVNRFVTSSFNNATSCECCQARVYPLEEIAVHGHVFHKNCFRCKECKAILRMDTYTYNQGLLYCTTHFKRLFISKGDYDTAFGLQRHKEKWNTAMA